MQFENGRIVFHLGHGVRIKEFRIGLCLLNLTFIVKTLRYIVTIFDVLQDQEMNFPQVKYL